ncbi:MAG TPA: TonB C-terminal domain-containing protein [Sulfurimonas sp.]|jgi:protein TonB|uniref:TonB C-terminal domain-containing protein n=1 Tax=Sulfurimonas sp. TaxID=2022749 RepID=UPI002C9DB9F2|nr:TonB C-terminal domain-containing protein [Sulfurimonas sp.]HUH43352.1 TonB C-terminal domain-containing protein [Sulfurimonas sp.]
MVNKDSYFYISGFISLSLFLFFTIIFFIAIVISKDVKSYALKKDDFVSVSLDMVNVQSANVKKAIDKPVEKEIEKPIVNQEPQEKTETIPQKKEIKIDDLFSQIWTKDIKKEDKKVEKELDKRVMQELSKKSQKSTENKVESISSKIEKVNSKDKAEKNSKSSTGSEVNEYFAKIQAIVYQHFSPPENSEGKMVQAVIELDSFGKVIDFRILRYSDSDSFNKECDKIKARLTNVLFPKNPDNKSGTYKINLISQE